MGLPDRIPSLKDLCCHTIVRSSSSLERSICDLTPQDLYVMKKHVCLPENLCESLIEAYKEEGHVLDDKFIHAFKDQRHAHLARANLRNSRVTDASLSWLSRYRLHSLDLSGCVEPLSDCFSSLTKMAPHLVSLRLGDRSGVIFDEPRVKRRMLSCIACDRVNNGELQMRRSRRHMDYVEDDTTPSDSQPESPREADFSSEPAIPYVEDTDFAAGTIDQGPFMDLEQDLAESEGDERKHWHVSPPASGSDSTSEPDLRASSRLSNRATPSDGYADIEYADADSNGSPPATAAAAAKWTGDRTERRRQDRQDGTELGSQGHRSGSASGGSSVSSGSGSCSIGSRWSSPGLCREYVLRGAKRLRELTAHQLQPPHSVPLLRALLLPCGGNLIRLDISSSSVPATSLAPCLAELPRLSSLLLHGVLQPGELRMFASTLVDSCPHLRHLDISHAKQQPVDFGRSDDDLYYLVSNLLELVSLDLSGTNLPGAEPLQLQRRSTAPPMRRQLSATMWKMMPATKLTRSISAGNQLGGDADATGQGTSDTFLSDFYSDDDDDDDERDLEAPIPALRDFCWPGSKHAVVCRSRSVAASAFPCSAAASIRRPRRRPPLEFLGLLGCTNDACFRQRLPAVRVTGDANASQIVESLRAYADRPEAAVECLNNLFTFLREQRDTGFKQRFEALTLLCNVMRENPDKANVQISGSASMFYLVKSNNVNKHLPPHELRHVVRTLFEGMQRHEREKTMLRNGLLTLCHFTIPEDVMFIYEDLVRLLLSVIEESDPGTDEFIQRISIYILNSLVCRVDNNDKLLVGERGAVKIMLKLIKEKLKRREGDEVLEFAWSTLWNITDEAASNCHRFMVGEDEAEGMSLFLQCYEMFPTREALLRNMMGLLGNVAEVSDLRSSLLQDKYIALFSTLLNCNMDGIEVSYNAAGVLSHILSDGEAVWNTSAPTRADVLDQLEKAIDRWDLNARRSINYRSFGPILRIVQCYHTPQAQHWAVWALCNLTNVYAAKYCPLLCAEGGSELLTGLLADSRPYERIKMLAEQIMRRLEDYRSGRVPDVQEGADYAL